MRYALLSYSTNNLGDEIQSIAARQFLPSVDALVDRDRPHLMPDDAVGRHKIVFNGWHTHSPENWPPSPALIPLLISIHLTARTDGAARPARPPFEALLKGESLDFLRAEAPVGARDLWTLDLLRAKDIESYFSGCLTLTLGQREVQPRGDYICAVDLDPRALAALGRMARGPVVKASHVCDPSLSFAQRFGEAERLLNLYANAKCVVTTRLHCALPCLALGTPVLFIVWASDTYRFTGLIELMRSCSFPEFLGGEFDFDFARPSPNSDAHLLCRRELIGRVNAFIDPARALSQAPLHPFRPLRAAA